MAMKKSMKKTVKKTVKKAMKGTMKWKKLLNTQRLKVSSRDLKNDSRNEFESDFGRIIFSPALRRMHDKTQVFPLTVDDNIHSRLSHSMEVMSIGYSLGLAVCNNPNFVEHTKMDKQELLSCVPIILKNSCLIHDIGNPPFGHFGETIIQNYFKRYFQNHSLKKERNKEAKQSDFENFDGNAQGLRVVTKLQFLNNLYGLNLTYATLASFIKYPNVSLNKNSKKKYIEKKKIGVAFREREYFKKIVKECGLEIGGRILRHPLCYLMEAADSMCYLIMDVEDGFFKKLISRKELVSALCGIEDIKSEIEEINQTSIRDAEFILRLRVYLFQILVKAVADEFVNNLSKIETGKYNKELLEGCAYSAVEEKLFKLCKENIFTNREINSLELTGDAVISGLLDYYIKFLIDDTKGDYLKRVTSLISSSYIDIAIYEDAEEKGRECEVANMTELDRIKEVKELSEYSKLRLIVDYISGMTDKFALVQYQKLNGQRVS